MARTSLIITHRRASDLLLPTGTLNPRNAFNRVLNLLHGFLAGTYPGASDFQVAQTQATGTLTFSGATGSVGGAINGVTVTATAAGGDVATAGLVAAAINASVDPLVRPHVTASNLDATGAATAVVSLTALNPGSCGNAVTLAASGTGVTASGARLTGGVFTSYTF